MHIQKTAQVPHTTGSGAVPVPSTPLASGVARVRATAVLTKPPTCCPPVVQTRHFRLYCMTTPIVRIGGGRGAVTKWIPKPTS